MKTIPVGRVARVAWYDSASHPGWQYTKDPGDVGRIVSVGYVVNNKELCLSLSTSIATDGGCIDPLTIPWACIQKIDVLPKEFSRNSPFIK